jgi:Holliday junction resolvase RusA-like endonuclease
VLTFRVVGDPVPAQRPRFTSRGRVHPARAPIPWMDDVRACAMAALRSSGTVTPPTRSPVAVELEFVFRRPKSHWRTGKHSARLRDRAPMSHQQRPDADNLAKAVLDAIGPWGDLPALVWWDDSQVVHLTVWKRWAELGEDPGVCVTITETET